MRPRQLEEYILVLDGQLSAAGGVLELGYSGC
jgi:hypothetical protein